MKKIKLISFIAISLCIISVLVFSFIIKKEPKEVSNIATEETENEEQAEVEENNELELATNQEQVPEANNANSEENATFSTNPNIQEKNTQESSSSKTTPITQVTTNSKPEQKQTQEQTQPQVNAEAQKQQTTQAQSSNNNKESFKENTAIINEIRNIINANPSTYMKQLGYNIVVDSSIVNLTTGFTYTQTRVRNAIANSFGTIRIYARDYYVGNELRWTEGFIL